MTTTTYNFTTHNHNLNDAFSNGESTTGTLEDAQSLAAAYECTVNLTNDAGWALGWVKADGTYQLG